MTGLFKALFWAAVGAAGYYGLEAYGASLAAKALILAFLVYIANGWEIEKLREETDDLKLRLDILERDLSERNLID